MKKYIFVLIALVATLTWSCQDESGDYIDQLQTNSVLSKGARSCLEVATDTAVAHVCIPGGMTETDYRITFPNSGLCRAIRDTMNHLGRTDLLDTLYNRVNRACEHMGNDVTSTFKAAIGKLVFDNPSDLVYGPSDTLTAYLRLYQESALRESLTSALNSQFQSAGATATWNEIVTLFNGTTAGPLSFDLNDFVMRRFVAAIFAEMGKEEALIRSDANHQVTNAIKNVFGN